MKHAYVGPYILPDTSCHLFQPCRPSLFTTFLKNEFDSEKTRPGRLGPKRSAAHHRGEFVKPGTHGATFAGDLGIWDDSSDRADRLWNYVFCAFLRRHGPGHGNTHEATFRLKRLKSLSSLDRSIQLSNEIEAN